MLLAVKKKRVFRNQNHSGTSVTNIVVASLALGIDRELLGQLLELSELSNNPTYQT